ncbi:hypothetical protein C8R44DRAFT_858952 [Mycena epipterygia]|nr:hypothetical protein C8R44DRAFT_858952 [Mycena epipterygia]
MAVLASGPYCKLWIKKDISVMDGWRQVGIVLLLLLHVHSLFNSLESPGPIGSRDMPSWFKESLLLVALIDCARAFTLSVPDKISTGTPVDVQWTRDSGDPTSFGLMQRSLEGNQPILSVTPVENSAGVTTGTVSMTFNTVGQVLLAVVSQLALSSGEKPNQLAAGKQLTVSVGVSPIASPPITTQPPPQSTRTTTTASPSSSAVPGQGDSAPSTSARQTLSKSAAAAAAASQSPAGTPVNGSPSSATNISEASNILASASFSLASASLSPVSPSLSPASPSLNPLPTSSAVTSISGPGNTSKHRAVIAAAILIPIFVLLLLAVCMIRRQRNSTRARIARFRNIWTRHSSARGTISSFGLDVESAIGTRADSPTAPPPGHGTSGRTGDLNLQVMVDALTERNAALQREMNMIASASASASVGSLERPTQFSGLEQARSSGGWSEEPPPVYVESAESSHPSLPSKPR